MSDPFLHIAQLWKELSPLLGTKPFVNLSTFYGHRTLVHKT